MKILSYVYLCTRNPTLNFGIIRFRICTTGFALAETVALQVLLFVSESDNFLFAVCTCMIMHVFRLSHQQYKPTDHDDDEDNTSHNMV